jgi:hypothetical protein
VVKKVVETSRKWVRIRQKYRKLLDSKSAKKEDLEKVRKSLLAVTSKLETAVLEFEVMYRYVQKHGMPKKKSFPWKEVLSIVSAGTRAVEKAMDSPSSSAPSNTIDVQAEIIDR